jgi:hypothetical protein
MEYNSTRNKLVIPEYGRNIQKMIEYVMTVEDRSKRTKLAEAVVNIMAQINPQQKDVSDLKHKLWDHLYIISDFKLDVDSPYPAPSPENLNKKPEKINYKKNNIRFRHYGKNMEFIIQKAIEYEEGPERDAFVKTIANHLKKSYLTWNRESVNDELIEDHLEILSSGKLKLAEDTRLNNTNEILARNRKKKYTGKQSGSNGGKRPRKNKSDNK